MSQAKVESELKLYTKPDTFQLELLTQLDIKEDILKEDIQLEDTFKVEAMFTIKALLLILLELTLQEEVELDKDKLSTELQELPILELTLLEVAELDKTTNINDCRYDFILCQ